LVWAKVEALAAKAMAVRANLKVMKTPEMKVKEGKPEGRKMVASY
jgi:hypothetical protein